MHVEHIFDNQNKVVAGGMLAAVESITLQGLEGRPVRVEVDIQSGLPCFHIVGLPDQSVKEAQDRVRSAIKNSGFQFPLQRVTVNLAPGDVKKGV